MPLPQPGCVLGYTEAQVEAIMGPRRRAFERWMDGSTRALCDGRRYNHETREYEPTGCGPHGGITYRVDVERFMAGRQQDD